MNRQKNTRTKRLSFLLGIFLLMGVFAGCTDGGTSSVSSAAGSKAVVSLPASSEAGGESSSVSVAAKTITFQVVHKDGTKKDFEISTEAENLGDALVQEKLIEGEDSEYGLLVKTVDGETVDDANQEWWCLTKGGEVWNYGVDSTELSDGDAYEFTFTVGY